MKVSLFKKSFLNIVGPLLCNGPWSDRAAAGGETKLEVDDAIINEQAKLSREKFVKSEFNFVKRFAYEFFIINIGQAAYRDEGSSTRNWYKWC